MSEFIKILLSLSFSGSLLLLILLLLKPLYKNKFSKGWQYYIYLIVAFRFLLPVTLNNDITLTGYLVEKINIIESKNDIIKNQKYIANNIQENNLKVIEYDKDLEEKSTSKVVTQQVEVFNKNNEKNYFINRINSIPYGFYLFLLWLIITLILFLRKVMLYQRFIHQLQDKSVQVSELEVLNLFANCEEKTKVKKVIEIYQNSFLSSPIMIGFFRPKIILSAGEYNSEEMFYIFLHELIHYKRLDIFYKWFIQIIICIHWFNPLVYLLGKEINKACELSCDEAVICLLGENEKEAYGNVLISTLKKESIYKNPSAFIHFTEDVKQIKERLGSIMEYKKKTNIIKGFTGIFTIIICICFSTIGVYASENKAVVLENKKEAVSKKVKTKESKTTVYKQEGFFCNSYVIEMRWNINKNDKKNVAKINIILEDKSEMTVYFSEEAKEYINDKKALDAIKETIKNLKNASWEQFPPIEIPYVCRIDYVPSEQISDIAKNYYKEEDIVGFSVIFSALDLKEREKYYKKMYQQDRVDFLICTEKNNVDKDIIFTYIKKAMEDDKIDIFSVLIDELPLKDRKKICKKYIEHYYETEDFAWFSILLDYLSNQEKQTWLERAKKDNNKAFYSIISDEI